MASELFKDATQICEPDERNLSLVLVDRETGRRSPYALEDVHRGLSGITLSASVPEYIQDHFTTARHLALYSWFVYRFLAVAQMQAYGTLEYALRERLGLADAKRPPGLRALLSQAIRKDLLREEEIRDWPGHSRELGTPEQPYVPGDWLRLSPEHISYMRNNLAHGSFTLMPDGGRTLRLVADIVNQLYLSTGVRAGGLA